MASLFYFDSFRFDRCDRFPEKKPGFCDNLLPILKIIATNPRFIWAQAAAPLLLHEFL
jgi:hypothetical protein